MYLQAAYDHIMSIDVCEVCLAPPLKCTGQLCSTFDETSQSEVLLCRSCKPAPPGEPKTIKSAAVESAVLATDPNASFDY